MITPEERKERQDRADRLKWAREQAGWPGPKPVSEALNISMYTYKAHETGRNDFGTHAARAYARLFKVSLNWLYFGLGSPHDMRVPGNNERLQDIFERLAYAPEDVQQKVISYAEFELENVPKSRETATSPAS